MLRTFFCFSCFFLCIFLACENVSGILRAMMERETLPDLDTLDSAALKASILSQHEQLASRDNEIEQLKLLIEKLRRMQFGRKSEKLDWQIEQLELKLDELEASRAGKETPPSPGKTIDASVHAKPARRPLPAHLPREEWKIWPKQEACPDCGGQLKRLGEDVSEILERVPEHFKVIRQIRRSWPAWVATGSCKPKRRAVPSPGAWRGRGCLLTCWSPNMATICRCIGNKRFMLGKEWGWSVPRWRPGWEE